MAHTKGFHALPRQEALEIINELSENLTAYVEEMKERLEDASRDYDNDAKGFRAYVRDTEKEFKEYWTEDLARFREENLPEALAVHWQFQREEHEYAAQRAEHARIRALAKVRKTRP